jgi:hypothetical protein
MEDEPDRDGAGSLAGSQRIRITTGSPSATVLDEPLAPLPSRHRGPPLGDELLLHLDERLDEALDAVPEFGPRHDRRLQRPSGLDPKVEGSRPPSRRRRARIARHRTPPNRRHVSRATRRDRSAHGRPCVRGRCPAATVAPVRFDLGVDFGTRGLDMGWALEPKLRRGSPRAPRSARIPVHTCAEAPSRVPARGACGATGARSTEPRVAVGAFVARHSGALRKDPSGDAPCCSRPSGSPGPISTRSSGRVRLRKADVSSGSACLTVLASTSGPAG